MTTIKPAAWRRFLRNAAALPGPLSDDDQAEFERYWIGLGDQIRAAVRDDSLCVRALRRCCRPYTGGPMEIWRGQSRRDYELGRLGISWGASFEVASCFGRHHPWQRTGGLVIVRAIASPAAIISRPRTGKGAAADELLGEVLVDPRLLGEVTIAAQFGETMTSTERFVYEEVIQS